MSHWLTYKTEKIVALVRRKNSHAWNFFKSTPKSIFTEFSVVSWAWVWCELPTKESWGVRNLAFGVNNNTNTERVSSRSGQPGVRTGGLKCKLSCCLVLCPSSALLISPSITFPTCAKGSMKNTLLHDGEWEIKKTMKKFSTLGLGILLHCLAYFLHNTKWLEIALFNWFLSDSPN